jgi:hypothetical protein
MMSEFNNVVIAIAAIWLGVGLFLNIIEVAFFPSELDEGVLVVFWPILILIWIIRISTKLGMVVRDLRDWRNER